MRAASGGYVVETEGDEEAGLMRAAWWQMRRDLMDPRKLGVLAVVRHRLLLLWGRLLRLLKRKLRRTAVDSVVDICLSAVQGPQERLPLLGRKVRHFGFRRAGLVGLREALRLRRAHAATIVLALHVHARRVLRDREIIDIVALRRWLLTCALLPRRELALRRSVEGSAPLWPVHLRSGHPAARHRHPPQLRLLLQ